MTVETQKLETSLGRLQVRLSGSGPAILFWPSLLMDGTMWTAVAEHFLARGFRTVLIDPPGAGGSDPLQRGFEFAECARCIVELLDGLELERAHFVGNSWGGMIGGTFAALHPGRVGAAVLMNATAAPAGLRHRLEYPMLTRIVRAFGHIPRPMLGRVIGTFVGPTTLRSRPEVVEHIRSKLRAIDVRSAQHAILSVVPRRPDQRSLFATIKTPVLVVAGEEDRVFPPSASREMASTIPGAKLEVLRGAAHLAGLECPEVVSPLIEKFIEDRGQS